MKQSFRNRQMNLEQESIDEAILNYNKVRSMVKILKPEDQLIKKLIEPLSKAVEYEQMLCMEKKSKGRPKSYCEPLLFLSPEKYALITIHRTLKACVDNSATMTKVAFKIWDAIYLEIFLEKIEEKHQDRLKYIRNSSSLEWKILYRIKKDVTLEMPDWNNSTKVRLGATLINLLIDSTDAFRCFDKYAKGKTIKTIELAERVKKKVEKKHSDYEKLIKPFYKPMVCEPLLWNDIEGGGYFLKNTSIIKRLKKEHKTILQNSDLRKAFKAVNLIQATPWRINNRILELLNRTCEIEDANVNPTKLPELECNFSLDENEKHKHLGFEKYRKRRQLEKLQSQCAQNAATLAIANEFKEEKFIFFPHYLDWRGRIYPFPKSLNPQGNDVARSLIEYGNGKQLGDSGPYWLAIHLSNLFGKDKCSFDARQDWVAQNEKLILDSANAPFNGQRFWRKADKPWCFLAACFEWQNYFKKGKNALSHIPVSLDGTCNGLQHYSAMGKDQKGALATNLINCGEPQDIYTEVLKALKVIVEKDFQKGIEEATNWNGRLSRKIVKKGVMTTPYGVKGYGLKEQLIKIITELNFKDVVIPGALINNANYLSIRMQKAIGEIVEAAHSIMKWLQKVAEILARQDLPIIWSTPIGFKVCQANKPKKRKEVRIGNQRLILRQEKHDDRISIRLQKQGFPPNFIHSLDAVNGRLKLSHFGS